MIYKWYKLFQNVIATARTALLGVDFYTALLGVDLQTALLGVDLHTAL